MPGSEGSPAIAFWRLCPSRVPFRARSIRVRLRPSGAARRPCRPPFRDAPRAWSWYARRAAGSARDAAARIPSCLRSRRRAPLSERADPARRARMPGSEKKFTRQRMQSCARPSPRTGALTSNAPCVLPPRRPRRASAGAAGARGRTRTESQLTRCTPIGDQIAASRARGVFPFLRRSHTRFSCFFRPSRCW